MAIQYMTQKTPGVFILRGQVSELPINAVEGDMYELLPDKKRYRWTGTEWVLETSTEYLSATYYTKAEVDSALQGLVTDEELQSVVTDLEAALANEASLSQSERDAVLAIVNDAIEEAQVSGGVTTEQVQQMIAMALAGLTTPLTAEQIQAIVDESISGLTMFNAPDYGNEVVTLGPDNPFFPRTESTVSGQQVFGEPYTVPENGYIVVRTIYNIEPSTYSGNIYFNLWVNNKAIVAYVKESAAELQIGYSFPLIEVMAGDVVKLSIQSGSNGQSFVPQGSGNRIIFYPVRTSSTSNPTYQDLSMFATTQALDMDAVLPLGMHKDTDRFRWQDTYDTQKDSIIRDAHAEGLIPDETKSIEVPASADPMTVNDQNGGVFGVKFANTDTTFTVITVNGEEVYSSDGLTANIPVTKWFFLRRDDTISATNATTFYYTPFMIDPNGAYAEREKLKQQIVELTEQVLDVRAQVAGKEPDLDNIIDIEAASQGAGYVVPDTYVDLGGRLTGAGIKALLANTGRVTVNDKEVYNNTSALGLELGVDAMQPVDVVSGDLVVSSGMDSLFFTPYKQRPIE